MPELSQLLFIVKLPPLEGAVKKLDTTLGMRKWVKYFARFEEEKLCFHESPQDDSYTDFVDLGMVTSIKQQHAVFVFGILMNTNSIV
jgi:hypothetical protein